MFAQQDFTFSDLETLCFSTIKGFPLATLPIYIFCCYFWCDRKKPGTFRSFSQLPQAETGNAQAHVCGGIPWGLSYYTSLNDCSWRSSAVQKRSSTFQRGTAQNSISTPLFRFGRKDSLIQDSRTPFCKQQHSRFNREERDP